VGVPPSHAALRLLAPRERVAGALKMLGSEEVEHPRRAGRGRRQLRVLQPPLRVQRRGSAGAVCSTARRLALGLLEHLSSAIVRAGRDRAGGGLIAEYPSRR
jgi:hypothetical protein